MPSERVQRQIDRLLEEAEEAVVARKWELVRECAQDVLALDPENTDALSFLTAAERRLGASSSEPPVQQPPTAAPPPSETAQLSHPTSFVNGRYQVKRFLGEGGKKKVYLAHDTLLDRDVAFALIKMEGLDDTAKARITREAQAMGRLGDHPHIVTVYDIGQEGDQPYIVSQFMAGGDVEGLIEKAEGHKLPIERTLEIARQVCSGLEHAHSKGIIHRDLKPGNVWLTADGVAKIGDFGLAVAMDRSRLTQAGMMIGTVSYMPPEQALGGQADFPSDLYSLGAMLYETIAGRPPFVGDDTISIISQHINTPAVAPSWHNPNCPKSLESLVLRLLSKPQAERPATATEVLSMLGSIDATPSQSTESRREDANPLDRLAKGTFVGRTQELAQGRDAVEDAFSGRTGLLLLAGDQGIGKTRLAEELGTYASLRGAAVLWGASYPGEGAPPYWPWVQALRGYVRHREPEQLRSELGSAGPEVAKVLSEVRERLPELPEPAQGDPSQERFRLFDAIGTFLRNTSASQPLVIVLDNLHFADQPTMLLAQFLLQEVREARVLIIATYRDVEIGRRHPIADVLAQLAQDRRFWRVDLKGLSRAEVGRMMEAITGEQPSPALLDRVYSVTEGVPLFVEEIVRMLTEEDGLRSSPSSISVPRTVREVIGRRLDRLSEEAIEVLTTAAVVGREFDFPILKEITGKDEDALLEVIEGALKARIIEEVEGSAEGYRFAHGLTRETLTSELSTARRARLHGRIGEALERLHGRAAERHAAELAYHFTEASTLSGAQEKAVRYSVLAARNAEAAYAYEEIIRHYEAALGLMDETADTFGQDEVVLRRSLAVAQRAAYRVTDAFRNFRYAMAKSLSSGDKQAAAELALEQDSTGLIPPELRVRILSAGLEAVPDPESELAAVLHARISMPLTVVQGEEKSEEHRQRAMDIVNRHGYREAELVLAVTALAKAAEYQLDLDAAPSLDRRLDELEKELGRTIVPNSNARCWWRLQVGDVAGARQLAQRYLEHARRARDAYWTNRLVVNLACTYLHQGEFREVLRIADMGVGQERGDIDYGIETVKSLALESLGEIEEARSRLERRAGNQARADALYSEVVEWLYSPTREPSSMRVANCAFLAFEAAFRHDIEVLTRCSEVLAPYDGIGGIRLGDSNTSMTVGRVLGVINAVQGQWDEAKGYLERALSFCEEKGLPVELAHCRMALADVLMHRNPATGSPLPAPVLSGVEGGEGQGEGGPSADDHERAMTLYDQALADCQRLGMPLYVKDVLARRELLKA